MSSLTEEQRKRIEANRQKALAIRRAKLEEAARQNSQTSNATNNKSINTSFNNSNNFPKKNIELPLSTNSNIAGNVNNISSCSLKQFNKFQTNATSKTLKVSNSNNNTTSKSSTSLFYGNDKSKSDVSSQPSQILNGTLTVLSEDRFVADVGYHKALIDVFKSVSSRNFNNNTKKWDFALSDHEELVKKIAPLRPAVCISPLPAKVVSVLREAAHKPPLDTIDVSCLDPRLSDSLLPFQLEGVKFGVRRQGRVLIADDMGLGKTIQALGIASFYRSDWPLLIVAPSSVRYSWLDSVERWLSVYSVAVINTSQDPITGPEIIITSYDLLSRRAEEFRSAKFGALIMDESHMLKNFKSARYKAAAPLIKKAKRVILLSGTPALSRPSELYTQIQSVEPKLFPNFQDFGIRYCAGKQLPWGWDFSGSSLLEELQVLLQASVMIRRLKANVLSQLPGKQRQMVILDPGSITSSYTKELKASANQLELKSLKGVERRSALLQFFGQTATAKIKAVGNYVKEMIEADKKFLVFAHHKVMLDHLGDTCEKAKVLYIRIDGSTAGDTRQALVDEFQRRDDVRVAVLSITAASTGLTLTAAKLVVFAELYWNPGILVQAEDRAHRLGQKDCVSVHYLVAKDTADDHIWPMVQEKLNILGKAGLSRDDFSESSATYQKRKTGSSILDFLVELTPEELNEMDSELDWEPPNKKMKV